MSLLTRSTSSLDFVTTSRKYAQISRILLVLQFLEQNQRSHSIETIRDCVAPDMHKRTIERDLICLMHLGKVEPYGDSGSQWRVIRKGFQ